MQMVYDMLIPTRKEENDKVNIPKLRAKIAENNIRVNDLMNLWGCTRACASRKINGKSEIHLDEAQKFADFARLTDEEKVEIFLK